MRLLSSQGQEEIVTQQNKLKARMRIKNEVA